MFKRPVPAKERVVVHTVARSTVEDQQREQRVNDYVKTAENEYVRLEVLCDEIRERQQKGTEGYYDGHEYARFRGNQETIKNSIAMITGADHIITGVRLERMADARKSERLPMTSFMVGLSPLYAESVKR
jgi:hypothetical protein